MPVSSLHRHRRRHRRRQDHPGALSWRSLSAELLLEVFEENPFLSDFYADRARYAFQTQIFFLLSRYRQQHSVIANTLSRARWSAITCSPRTGYSPT